MPRPDPTEHAPYYGKYVALVPEDDVLAALEGELARTLALLRGVPDEEARRRHPPYTWSVKEVVGHLVDAERVFGYRAMRFARGDATPLPGFDENAYVPTGQFDRRPLADIAAEFEALRRSHLALFRGLPPDAWDRRGSANNNEISVRALAYILVGHERHHTAILRRRLSAA
jgi:hypothetical protein